MTVSDYLEANGLPPVSPYRPEPFRIPPDRDSTDDVTISRRHRMIAYSIEGFIALVETMTGLSGDDALTVIETDFYGLTAALFRGTDIIVSVDPDVTLNFSNEDALGDFLRRYRGDQ